MKKTLSIILSLLMVMTTLFAVPFTAKATTQKAIQLVDKSGEYPVAANIIGAQTSNVYFGACRQSTNESGNYLYDAIKWRVLSNESGKLFLLSDKIMDANMYQISSTPTEWQDCYLRNWLNGTGSSDFYYKAFNSRLQPAIATTNVVNLNNPEYGTNGGGSTEDKVFLLSIDEATYPDYGFEEGYANSATRKATSTEYAINQGADYNNYWWLRSPGQSSDKAAFVNEDGLLSESGVDVVTKLGVRPAINLDLNSVLFTSAAEVGKECTLGSLEAVGDYTGNDWKLTVLVNNYNGFTAAFDSADEDVWTVKYKSGSAGSELYVSAVIVNESGEVTYYGRLCKAKLGNDNTVTVDLTGKMNEGDKLYVFEEEYRGGKEADEASPLREITKPAPAEVSSWAELEAALAAGGNYILTADVTPENPYWADALVVPSGITATLDLNGHTVDRGYREQGFDGSVIKVNGKLTVNDSSTEMTGAITGGWPEQYGGGVYIDGGTFNLQGGSITGNSVGKNGFGAMEGVGGGVYLQSGSFNMSGGKITGNKAANSNPMAGGKQGKGGGVYVNSGTFTLTGGTITGNEAGKLGGGVYIASTYSSSDGKINVSGNPSVTGNSLNGTENNVYIEDGGDFIVTDELTGVIGVTMQTPGIFTIRLYGNGTIANFTSDNADYHVAETGGEAQLAEHNWKTEWSKDRTNHWHACEGCTAKKDEASHSYGDWEPVDDTNHSHSCEECGSKGTEAHTFGVATYTWNGLTSVTAKHTCSTCNKEVTETANTTSQVTTPATCTGKEITTYTANFTKAGFTTQTKEVETSDALDHLWAAPTYVWSADNKTVTATRICTRDASHTENEIGNATYEITKPATCTEQGEITYTATFTNAAFETQTKKVDTPPNDHSWKTEWSKDENNHWHDCNNCTEKNNEAPHNYGEVSYEWTGTASVKATRVCADCDYEDTETVNTTSEQTKAPTCTVKGETTYTATFTNTAFETQTKTEANIDALGHKYGTEGDSRFTCTVCGTVDEAKKAEAEKADKEAAAETKTAQEKAEAEFFAGINGASSDDGDTISWTPMQGAVRYDIYATYCAKKKYKKVKTVSGNTTTIKLTKLFGKKLKKNKNVKFYIVAYKNVNGKDVKLSTSPTFHIAGKKSKNTNVKKIKVKKNKFNLSAGKTAKIKASLVLENKKKKPIKHVAKFRYVSSNTAVAKVSKSGMIKAVGKGTATIYVFSNNGTAKAVTVIVK